MRGKRELFIDKYFYGWIKNTKLVKAKHTRYKKQLVKIGNGNR